MTELNIIPLRPTLYFASFEIKDASSKFYGFTAKGIGEEIKARHLAKITEAENDIDNIIEHGNNKKSQNKNEK